MIKIKDYIMKNKYMILSFIIPIVAMLIGYKTLGVYPFGDKSILISDLNGQYVDYFSALHNTLRSGDLSKLLYSWNMGMGSNFVGLIAYYLSSPFTLLTLLFPKENIVEALLLVTLLKIGLSGLTFSIFIKYVYKELNLLSTVFACMYALMGFNLVYSFDIMWLDSVLMLPLVIIGVEEIVRNNKWVMFFVTILITFVSNFYMSYMVGIFSFIYFVGIYYCNYYFSKENIKLFFGKFLTFMKATFLAVGSCAVLLIPTFLAIKNGGIDSVASVNMYDINGIGGIISKSLRVMSKLFIGAYDSLTTTRGTANIYSGVIIFLLVPVFFASKKIKMKEKVFSAFVLLLLFIGFVDPMSNLIWHAFDTPTGFPSRYSYIFTFMILSISYKGLMMVVKDKTRKINLNAISIFAVLFIILQSYIIFKLNEHPEIPASYVSKNSIVLSLVFVVGYAVLLRTLRTVNPRRFITILSLVIVVELVCSTSMILGGLDGEVAYKDKNKYGFVSELDKDISFIKSKDDSFYRVETDSIRSLNDSMNLNFNGIKHFSSMANKKLHQFLNEFGFANSDFDLAMSYYGATPISDSLFGVKYVVSDKNKPEDYKKVFSGENKENIYLNKNALPLLYSVNEDVMSLGTGYNNPFEMQNDMLNLMLGNERGSSDYKSYFKRVDIDEFVLKNLEKIDKSSSSLYKKIKNSDEAYIEFKTKDDTSSRIYLFVPTMARTSMDILVDEMYLDSYGGYYSNTIFGFDLNESKESNVKLRFNRNRINLGDICAYSFDESSFRESMAKLKSGGAKDLVVSNTNVSGTVVCDADEMLFTSIPFDPGWKVYVDGKEAQIESVSDAFVGVRMDKGVHEVRFEFMPSGFIVGLGISVLTWTLLLVMFLRRNKSEVVYDVLDDKMVG